MRYIEYYHKYKEQYIQLKKQTNSLKGVTDKKGKERKKKDSYKYLHKLRTIPVPEYQLKLFKKYLNILDNKNVLEVGIGNAMRSVPLSKLFKSYIGIEPNEKLFKLAKENCKQNDCSMIIKNTNIDDFESNNEYDMIIFINVFHFLNKEKTASKLFNLLETDGIIFIDEPKPIPKGWGMPALNKDSGSFDPMLWTRKKQILESIKDFLLHKTRNIGFKTDHYERGSRNIFILSKI